MRVTRGFLTKVFFMLKKTFISSMIFLSTTSVVFAETMRSYVGGSLGMGGYSQIYGLSGANATVFGGKGALLGEKEKIYLGGEWNAGVGIHPTALGVGASIIPGVMLTKSTMLYSRIGLGSYYRPKDNLSIEAQVGLGVQTKVAKHWDVRAEYISSLNLNKANLNMGLVYKFD